MTKKFTEEQYQKIIDTWEHETSHTNATRAVIYYLDYEQHLGYMVYEAFAIANPLTREWAHEQFVEKEKKYYWTTKKLDKYGVRGRLYKTTDDSIKPYFDAIINDTDEQLTESEIREWGYNPDMFDKEEVK